MDIHGYWRSTLSQNAEDMRSFFHSEAYVNWHNTNEHFTVDEFIDANCEYPGDFNGEIERIETVGDLIITVVHVFSQSPKLSFHVTSFLRIRDGLVVSIDEYWGDDGLPPQWRLDKNIGTSIK